MTPKERPILMSGPMVRAILDGRKTQTRRVINCACNSTHIGRLLGDWSLSESPRQWDGEKEIWRWQGRRKPKAGDWIEVFQTDVDDNATAPVRCPFNAGDRIWVRETFLIQHRNVIYRTPDRLCETGIKWKPSIFMPRWASRITLEIVSVRVERLQDISGIDCLHEGIIPPRASKGPKKVMDDTLRGLYMNLWDSLNAKSGYGWNTNPWVWAIEFSKLPNSNHQTTPTKKYGHTIRNHTRRDTRSRRN